MFHLSLKAVQRLALRTSTHSRSLVTLPIRVATYRSSSFLSSSSFSFPSSFTTCATVKQNARFFSTEIPPPPTTTTETIIDVTKETFQSVIQGSSSMPTIIDCYADWCQPCKTLTPMLEAAVRAANGKVILAKINTDEQPELAKALNVSSLPSVFGIINGEAVDTFIGVPSPDKFDSFMEKMLAGAPPATNQHLNGGAPMTAEQEIEYASKVLHDMNDFEMAASLYQAILQRDDVKTESLNAAIAMCGLLSSAIKSGNKDAIRGLIEHITDEKSPHLAHIKDPTHKLSTIIAEGKLLLSMEDKLKALEGDNGVMKTLEELQTIVKKDNKNIDAYYSIAVQHLSTGELSKSIDAALRVVRLDKTWNDAAGKTLLLEIFEMLGNDNALVKDGRRRMTNLLL